MAARMPMARTTLRKAPSAARSPHCPASFSNAAAAARLRAARIIWSRAGDSKAPNADTDRYAESAVGDVGDGVANSLRSVRGIERADAHLAIRRLTPDHGLIGRVVPAARDAAGTPRPEADRLLEEVEALPVKVPRGDVDEALTVGLHPDPPTKRVHVGQEAPGGSVGEPGVRAGECEAR